MTEPVPLVCRWCDEPASTRRDVVPAEYTASGLIRKAAIEADVCKKHAAMVDAEVQRRALERRIRLAENALRRATIDSPGHRRHLRAIENAKVELQRLETP